MPVYIQEEKPRLQCGEKRATATTTIDNDPAQDDDSNDNDDNDIFAKSRTSFQPHHHNASSHPRLEVAALPPLQSKFINDTMNDIREKELAAVATSTTPVTTAAVTTTTDAASAASNNNHDRGQDDVVRVARSKKRKICSGGASNNNNSSRSSRDNNWTSIFLDRLSSNLDTAQIVATSGGLVTYWNDTFCNIIQSSATRLRNFPLTIFELIEPRTLPKLYAMLALALHDIGIVVEEEDSDSSSSSSSSSVSSNNDDVDERRCDCDDDGRSSALSSVGHHPTTAAATPPSSSHLSITLPCKSFRGDPTSRYNITIIFMHDLSSRCFVGILTPQAPSSSIIPDNVVSSISNAICDDEDDDDEYEQEEEVHSSTKKTTTTKTVAQARSSSLLPIGRMLRLRDDVLCQMIYDSE